MIGIIVINVNIYWIFITLVEYIILNNIHCVSPIRKRHIFYRKQIFKNAWIGQKHIPRIVNIENDRKSGNAQNYIWNEYLLIFFAHSLDISLFDSLKRHSIIVMYCKQNEQKHTKLYWTILSDVHNSIASQLFSQTPHMHLIYMTTKLNMY